MPETPDTVQPVVQNPQQPASTEAGGTPMPEAVTNPIVETGPHTPHLPLEHAMTTHDDTKHAAEAQKELEGTGAIVTGPTVPVGDGSSVTLDHPSLSRKNFMDRLANVISLSALRKQIFPSKESGLYKQEAQALEEVQKQTRKEEEKGGITH